VKKLKKGKTLPQLKKKALDIYAELVKLKAFKEGNLRCYTCDAPLQLNTSNCQLGHYLSRGAYPGLTFHIHNSRPQCYRCNCHLHGATFEFRVRLIGEIGLDSVVELEDQRHDPVKLSRLDYIDMIVNFRNEIKELSGT
jgi:hypothetical protein